MNATAITRTEHLEWCKTRALAELDANGPAQGFASMASDLGKHPDTADHAAIKLGMILMFGGHLDLPGEMRKFILGFN